jgi:hypothetical protein
MFRVADHLVLHSVCLLSVSRAPRKPARAAARSDRDPRAALRGVPHGDVTREMIARASPEQLLAGVRHSSGPPSKQALDAAANGRVVPPDGYRATQTAVGLRSPRTGELEDADK